MELSDKQDTQPTEATTLLPPTEKTSALLPPTEVLCPCKEQKCMEKWTEFIKEFKTNFETDDSDFLPNHCHFCHAIDMGKTSFPCDDCKQWVCQCCAEYDEFQANASGSGTICPTCWKKPKHLRMKRKKSSKTNTNK